MATNQSTDTKSLPRKSPAILKLDEHQARPKSRRGSTVLLVFALIALLAVVAFMTFQIVSLRSNPAFQGQAELDKVVSKVGRLVVLPENEIPTLATVTDPEKLKDQPFFANAEEGFKVLLFSQSRKAILYDPKSDKVVEIAPINPSAPITAEQTPAADGQEVSGQ